MKQTLKSIIRNFKSIKGNSLAEFATTTALMATLAATAAPKLSEMSEGTKAEKSRNEIDKMIKQGGQFYQDTADTEGRGRFPNQDKFNEAIGGATEGERNYSNAGGSKDALATAIGKSKAHSDAIMKDLGLYSTDGGVTTTDGWQNYVDVHENEWTSVFGGYKGDATIQKDALCKPCGDDPDTPDVVEVKTNEWSALFGDEALGSTFQDGHYVYTVVGGGGTGNDVYPPVLYVVDIENAVDFNNVLEP